LDNNYKYLKDQSITDFNISINKLFILLKDYIDNKDIQSSQFSIPVNLKINNEQTFKKYVRKSISQLKKININSLLYDYSNSLYKNEWEKILPSNSLLYKHFSDYNYSPFYPLDLESLGAFEENTKKIINYFVNDIYYIGPLREEPHLQYDKYCNDIINIGTKGENCANVFYYNINKIIKYIEPAGIENDIKSINIKESQLYFAISTWLKYIKVAENISVKFNGRYGYELKIKSFGKNKTNDLTNVGVGVSQVLPIVLTCLLAPEKSTIIIEQPELHLHPAMQSRLTDFFVATILCNKQLIIETHSEYIINRLRLRAINWPTEKPIDDSVKIYFTENLEENYKDYKKGNTIFRPLKINEYAAMSDWPEGFFDESSKIADEIFSSASQKWKQKMDETI
jgi:predicted ATPase